MTAFPGWSSQTCGLVNINFFFPPSFRAGTVKTSFCTAPPKLCHTNIIRGNLSNNFIIVRQCNTRKTSDRQGVQSEPQTGSVSEASQICSRHETDKLSPVNAERLKTARPSVDPHRSIIHSTENWTQPKTVSNITTLSEFALRGRTI